MHKVLIITALQEELDSVLRLKTRGIKDWTQKSTGQGYLYYESDFYDKEGNTFELIASAQPKFSKTFCASHTTRMLHVVNPQMALMVGICAGRRKKGIELGDIIVADKAFDYETGKQSDKGFEPELASCSPTQAVIQWLNDFHSRKDEWVKEIDLPRPLSLRFQKDWILFELEEGFLWPSTEKTYEEIRSMCPNWEQALESLSNQGFVETSPKLKLTDRGKEHLSQLKTKNLVSKPTPDKNHSSVLIGAFATGSSVISKDDFFDQLAQRERKVLALDMEASAFLEAVAGHSASLSGVVIKGVCDFADKEKDDAFHTYAGDVSAKWMLAFIKYALPLIENKTTTAENETIIFPLSLPRPAKTLQDRKRWQLALQWPADYEDFFEAKYDDDTYSGLEFYKLGRKEYLLEVSLGFGAYQGNSLYIYLDERNTSPKWEIIKFRRIYADSVDESMFREADESEIMGFTEFNEKERELYVFTKSRGIGDCGSVSKYKIENGIAILTELRIKDCDDAVYQTSDESLREMPYSEEDSDINPDEWPLVDITQIYPPLSF